jgi:flagellar biogenesis protein FliO
LVLSLLSLLIWGILRLIAPGMAGMARTPGSHRKLLNILEKHSLGPGRGLMVVEVAGRHLLVGMTEHGVQTLAELDPEQVRLAQQAPSATDPALPGTSEPSRNLLREVLTRHLAALPNLSPRQKGPEPR